MDPSCPGRVGDNFLSYRGILLNGAIAHRGHADQRLGSGATYFCIQAEYIVALFGPIFSCFVVWLCWRGWCDIFAFDCDRAGHRLTADLQTKTVDVTIFVIDQSADP